MDLVNGERGLEETLTEWRAPQVIIEKLVGQMFTIESLLLPPPALAELVPQAGPRTLISHNLTKLREKSGKERTRDTTEPPAKRACEAGTSSSSSSSSVSARNEVHSALIGSVDGDIVLSYYQRETKLSEHTRDILATRVIYGELKPDYEKTIDRARYSDLADQIVVLFPTESKETWFDIVNKKNKKGKVLSIVEGRLRHKFYHTRQKLVDAGLIEKRTLINSLVTEENLVDDVDDDDNAIWLQNNSEPWSTVVEKWEETYRGRKRQAESVDKIYEYVSKYPALSKQFGWELVLIDWKLDPVFALANQAPDWKKLAKFILAIVRKEFPNLLIKSEFDSDDECLATALKSFAYVFKVRSLLREDGKKVWKPSRTEVQDAFLLHINEISSLKDKLKERTDRLSTFGFSLQLLPVIVGPLDNIRQCLIVLDNCRWKVQSVAELFDVTFKVFFGLSAHYPIEASHLWLFIQKAVYNINLDCDFARKNRTLRSFLAARLQEYSRLSED